MSFVLDGRLKSAGYVQITDLSAPVTLTPPNGTNIVLIQAEGQPIRYRDDGEAPSSSVGMVIDAGQTIVYNGEPSSVQLIAAVGGAIANITYYRS